MPNLSKLFEFRVFLILVIITLTWHLLGIFASFFAFFADIFLLLVLAWILAFILEPLVTYLMQKKISRTISTVIVYLGIAIISVGLVSTVIPTIVSQFTQLATVIPAYLPQNYALTPQVESFLTASLTNSVQLASQVASAVTSFVLIFILSFYLLVSKKEISQGIKNLIPDDYEEDYTFLGNVLNKTFASFLRIQVVLGLVSGLITFFVLWILNINFALSISMASAILAMVPVVGPILFLFPAMLAAITISLNKLVIVTILLILTSQFVYSVLAPRLIGQALKIHPVIVLISFLIGFKIAGVWGAIFAVPVTSSLLIISEEILLYWKQEADK